MGGMCPPAPRLQQAWHVFVSREVIQHPVAYLPFMLVLTKTNAFISFHIATEVHFTGFRSGGFSSGSNKSIGLKTGKSYLFELDWRDIIIHKGALDIKAPMYK